MAIKKEIELVADFSDASKATEDLQVQFDGLDKSLEEVQAEAKQTDKAVSGIGKAFKGVGTALKALGLGVVIGLIAKLTDSLGQSQPVIDFFSTAMGTLNRIFSDLIDSILNFEQTWNRIKGFFSDLADDPVKAVKGLTGAIKEYATATYDAAKATVELENAAQIAEARNALLLAQYDRQAEKLRQIRDDERLTIEERIEANNKLGEVLEDQERVMLANVNAAIKLAKANLEVNNNVENQVALLNALADQQDILATIEGFRSEQLINDASLERELLEQRKVQAIDLTSTKIQQAEIETKANFEALKQQQLDARRDAEIRMQLEEQVTQMKISLASQSLGAISGLFEQGSIAYKGFAAAQAVIDGIGAVQAVFKSASANPATILFPGFPFIQAAIMGVATAANVKRILSTDPTGANVGGNIGSAPIPAAPAAPQFNLLGGSGTNQIADAVSSSLGQTPIRAFVVSKEVSTKQELDRNIVKQASL